MNVPLKRFVALAFVEEIAEAVVDAVKVQFVQIIEPLVVENKAAVVDAVIALFETFTTPEEALATPYPLPDPPIIAEDAIFTTPETEAFEIAELFPPPANVDIFTEIVPE